MSWYIRTNTIVVMNSAKNSTPTDSELLSLFVKSRQSGSDEDAAQVAFRRLVTRYERLVWTICQRQLSSWQDSEDAFQTTFLLLASKAHKIRKPESLASWLYGVAWKTATGLRRKINRRRKREMEQGGEAIALVSSNEGEPLEAIAIRYENEKLDEQLALLHEKYRAPLVMFYFSGLTTKQISRRLGISVSAAEGRLKRGRTKLRTNLASQGIFCSPVLLGSILVANLRINPELVTATCQQLVTTAAPAGLWSTGSSSIFQNNSIGTKVMICKTFCTLAIVGLTIVGGYLHSQPTQNSGETKLTVVSQSQDTPRNQIQILDEEGLAEPCCEGSASICDAVCDHIHEHVKRVHMGVIAHLRYFHGK